MRTPGLPHIPRLNSEKNSYLCIGKSNLNAKVRYIGSKRLLVDFIGEAIAVHAPDVRSVSDVFAGSGVVSGYLLNNGYDTISNDILYFSYVLSRGTHGIHGKPRFENLGIKDPVEYLNNLKAEDCPFSPAEFFITNNYSPSDTCSRMYFQPKNAVKIDIIRLTIEQWKKRDLINDDEYYYLLAALLHAIPYVANITGVYAAYLKHWDKRTYNDLTLTHHSIIEVERNCACYNLDYREIIQLPADMLYADPPYNERDYSPNYHILETIARYDYPQISGVTGLRPYSEIKSPFCSKRTVTEAFENLISGANARHIMISYNNESLLPYATLEELCRAYAAEDSFRLLTRPYRRYKNKIPNNSVGLEEELFLFVKK